MMKRKSKIRTKGYTKIRRGLSLHLSKLTSPESKLFLVYLLQVQPFDIGQDKICALTNEQLSGLCGWTLRWTLAIKKNLVEKGYLVEVKEGTLIKKYEQKLAQ